MTVPRIISSAGSRFDESAPENVITRAYMEALLRSGLSTLRRVWRPCLRVAAPHSKTTTKGVTHGSGHRCEAVLSPQAGRDADDGGDHRQHARGARGQGQLERPQGAAVAPPRRDAGADRQRHAG